MSRANRSIIFTPGETQRNLEAAGFVDIKWDRIRLPIGEYSTDPHEVLLGRWYRVGITEALEALSLAPFTRAPFNWPVSVVKSFLPDVEEVLKRADIHAYNYL